MKIVLAFWGNLVGVSGGLQKVYCNFANEMIARGHQVLALYSCNTNGEPYCPLDINVERINTKQKFGSNVGGCNYWYEKVVRECIRLVSKKSVTEWNQYCGARDTGKNMKSALDDFKPDIIISFDPGTTVIFTYYLEISYPVITMIHSEPVGFLRRYTKKELAGLRRCMAIQVLLPEYKKLVERYLPGVHCVCIPNVIPQYDKKAILLENKKIYKIINVGRLDPVKGQELLIDAFAILAPQYPNWILEIYGGDEGLGGALQKKIDAFGLQNRILLMGERKDILDVYLSADIFAFPSFHEGFGLALGEAMSAGLPVVALRSCTSARAIVDSTDGILTSDQPEDFAKGLERLMREPTLRQSLGHCGKLKMRNYESTHIWNQWEALINDCGKGENRG